MTTITERAPRRGLLALTILALALTVGSPAAVRGQHDPRVEPAPAYAVRGATIHTLVSGVGPIESGTVVVRDGEIVAVGADVEVPADASVIDASGLHVYPGIMDAFSRLGLTEVGAVAASVDTAEITRWNPHLAAATAFHPATEHIPVARANGITHALVAPGSGGGYFGGDGEGGIPGRAALVHLAGWTVEDMAEDPSLAMVVEWPEIQTRSFDFSTFSFEETPFTEAKKAFDEALAELEEWFEAAAHYKQATERGDPSKVERNLKLEHLARTLGGELPVIAVADDERSIESALELAERWDLELILAGGDDAREVAEELAAREVPVILGPTQSLPDEEDDPYHAPFSLAGELHAAGVSIAFSTFGSSDSRTVPYEAASAVPFGLPREEALRAITVGPAKILGAGDRLGTIEAGKVGNLMVTDGDPLEIRTRVEYVFVGGVPADLSNKHRELYQEYRKRPEPAGPGG